jgi:hypothetical protein
LADALFSQIDIPENKRLLVGLIVLGFATKLHEEEGKQVKLGDIQRMTRDEFGMRPIASTEILFFNSILTNTNAVTVPECVSLFLSSGILFSNDVCAFRPLDDVLLAYLRVFSELLADLTVQGTHYTSPSFTPNKQITS